MLNITYKDRRTNIWVRDRERTKLIDIIYTVRKMKWFCAGHINRLKDANMKVSEQCRIAASKGNQILGMIRRNITYKENGLIYELYKAIVRPHF